MARRLAVPLALVLIALPAVATAPRFEEDFTLDADGWQLSGPAAVDCARGQPVAGCSMLLSPTRALGADEAFYRANAVREVELPLDGPTEVTFHFQGSSVWNDIDSAFFVVLDTGRVGLHVTDTAWSLCPGCGNSGLSLEAPTDQDRLFGAWNVPGAWYGVRLALDPAASTVVAEVFDATGAPVATSRSVSLPAGTSEIRGIQLSSVSWFLVQGQLNYDTIRIS